VAAKSQQPVEIFNKLLPVIKRNSPQHITLLEQAPRQRRGNLQIIKDKNADQLPKIHATRILPSSGLLRGVMWFKTDVSGLPIGTIFKGQTPEDGTES
jgi:hypothetical protein